MQVVVTAVGPDNRGLADPIVHHVTSVGGNICEIQMYDHDVEQIFAMHLRMDWSGDAQALRELKTEMARIGQEKGLSIRTWARPGEDRLPRIAVCATYRPEPPLAVLRAIRDRRIKATPAVMIGNREACRSIAEQFEIPWRLIGDANGRADNELFTNLLDEFEVDYVVLARYMQILPASICWKYAGGRIINLHHGLLPSFPGPRPYHDAYARRMLTYGSTCHFIIPELDAGDQIIHQSTFTVAPGTPLEEIQRLGQTDNEPTCLVEGLRRVVDREVALHFHKVVRAKQ
ncbi:MAG TPA: formyltransferase family protein [Pirellulales bacterium]